MFGRDTHKHMDARFLYHRWNETIHIACLDEDGEDVKDCAWKVPRRRLSPIWLQTMCLSCPMHVKVSIHT